MPGGVRATAPAFAIKGAPRSAAVLAQAVEAVTSAETLVLLAAALLALAVFVEAGKGTLSPRACAFLSVALLAAHMGGR